MNVEFFTILDNDDPTIPTGVFSPGQILGDIIDTKTDGKSLSKIYKPNLPENHRVYTYNFKKQCVETDEIVAIEHVIGEHTQCELSTYKTTPIQLCCSDNIASVDRTAGYKLKFSNSSDLLNVKGLAVLQVENYVSRCEDDDMSLSISEDHALPMTFDGGLLIGHWLGLGQIETFNDEDQVVFHPKHDTDKDIILSILGNMFPDNEDLIYTKSQKRGPDRIVFNNPVFASWLRDSHGESEQKELPMAYYSAPTEFISGVFYGLMMTVGRFSLNHRKKVMYYTFSSISEILTRQIIELLNVYASTHAKLTDFIIEKTQRQLFLANIRITEDVLENLSISSFVDGDIDPEYIPKANRHALKKDDNVMVITRMTIKQVDGNEDDYIIHLRNSSSIIGTTGLVHQAKCSCQFSSI